MRMLKFAVEGQQLAKRGDFAGVTAGSKGYLRCHFEQSDPEWLMAKKIAVSQSTSGDIPESGLDALNSDGDSVEVALARQLVGADNEGYIRIVA